MNDYLYTHIPSAVCFSRQCTPVYSDVPNWSSSLLAVVWEFQLVNAFQRIEWVYCVCTNRSKDSRTILCVYCIE